MQKSFATFIMSNNFVYTFTFSVVATVFTSLLKGAKPKLNSPVLALVPKFR